MNQTRILLGVILLLATTFGYLQWSQQKDLAKERDEQKKMLEALLVAQSGGSKPAASDQTAPKGVATGQIPAVSSPNVAAAAVPPTGAATSNSPINPPGGVNAGVPPQDQAVQTADQRWRMLKDQEIAKMREENEALRLQGQAAIEERDRLSAELEVAKFQIDRRMAQIREAPMVGRVTRVVPEHGFLVISAGRMVGIEPKDEFSIRRDGKVICQIRISDSVDEAESVADPIRGSMAPGESVREGDEVIKMD